MPIFDKTNKNANALKDKVKDNPKNLAKTKVKVKGKNSQYSDDSDNDNDHNIKLIESFKKASGLKVDIPLLKEIESLIFELDKSYTYLYGWLALILESKRNNSPDLQAISNNYLRDHKKNITLRKQLDYLQKILQDYIKSNYNVIPDQDLINSLFANDFEKIVDTHVNTNGSKLLWLAGFLPDQEGISKAIANGRLDALLWLADKPRYVIPNQNNVNLAYAAKQWDIVHWLTSPPYNRRPNKNTVTYPDNYLEDIESMYKIKEKLGEGAFGTVYKAIDKKTNNVYALKMLDPKKINEAELEQEIGLLAEIALNTCNKNVVCYYGAFPANYLGKPVMVVVMEFIDGKDIWETFEPSDKTLSFRNNQNLKINSKITDKPLDKALARHITERLLKGLKFLHDMGIYHLDIKESNVMVKKDNLEPVYVDFGLACKENIPVGPFSCDKANGGSPYYMSKNRVECLKNNSCTEQDNRQTDIWALGILLLKVLSRVDIPNNNDFNFRYKDIANWLDKNKDKLYPYDKNINDVINLALSGNMDVTVDTLLNAFYKQ